MPLQKLCLHDTIDEFIPFFPQNFFISLPCTGTSLSEMSQLCSALFKVLPTTIEKAWGLFPFSHSSTREKKQVWGSTTLRKDWRLLAHFYKFLPLPLFPQTCTTKTATEIRVPFLQFLSRSFSLLLAGREDTTHLPQQYGQFS